MKIKLTPIEIYQAGVVGLARRIDSIKKGLTNKVPSDAHQWQVDIEGALAEMAVAKGINRYAGLTIGNYGGADVDRFHVRHSQRPDACLIVRPEDDADAWYVLVTGLEGEYVVHGHIHGRDTRQREWWREPNNRPGAWFVPQAALTAFV
jgi:hypothetical protein